MSKKPTEEQEKKDIDARQNTKDQGLDTSNLDLKMFEHLVKHGPNKPIIINQQQGPENDRQKWVDKTKEDRNKSNNSGRAK